MKPTITFGHIGVLFNEWYEVHGLRIVRYRGLPDNKKTKQLMKLVWSYGFINGDKG